MSAITYRVALGDVREQLRAMPEASAQCVVTSPPYWALRDYGVPGQLGLEATPEAFVAAMVDVFRDVRRVLRPDGTLWLNLGDTYAGGGKGGGSSFMLKRKGTAWGPQSEQRGYKPPPAGLKPKDLVGIPWRTAFALQADGWWLRSDIVWSKPNPMPEAVTDRPSKAHEYVFLLTPSERYLYDADAIREPLARKTYTSFGTGRRRKGGDALGAVKADNWSRDVPTRRPRLGADGAPAGANARTVWTVASQPCAEAHFATFPEGLVRPCILAGSRPGDVVLDPFSGSGTTGVVALKLGRSYVGVELNPEYRAMSLRRLRAVAPLLAREDEGVAA